MASFINIPLILGTINPIIKDKTKLYNDLNNQRPTTKSNALVQLFERLILETSDSQF